MVDDIATNKLLQYDYFRSESAMDKYAMTTSKETGVAHSAVRDMDMTEKPVDETQLAKELKVTSS